jgi:hypothetical protein
MEKLGDLYGKLDGTATTYPLNDLNGLNDLII